LSSAALTTVRTPSNCAALELLPVLVLELRGDEGKTHRGDEGGRSLFSLLVLVLARCSSALREGAAGDGGDDAKT
jgi:hypothetical protein